MYQNDFFIVTDTIKELMFYPKCRSVEIINNSARPGSIHKKDNYIYIIEQRDL